VLTAVSIPIGQSLPQANSSSFYYRPICG